MDDIGLADEVLVANAASDNGQPVAPRRPGAGADLDGPGLDAFDAAGYRGVPARNDDAEVDHVLRPLATAAWALVRQASGLAAFALGT